MARHHGQEPRKRDHFQKRRRLRTRAPSGTNTLDDADLNYSGDWTHENTGASTLIDGTQSWTGDPDASLSFTFTGTGFEFWAGTKTDRGAFQYTVGGSAKSGTQAGTSDAQAPKASVVARERNLDYGSHTVVISNDSANYMGADAVVILDDSDSSDSASADAASSTASASEDDASASASAESSSASASDDEESSAAAATTTTTSRSRSRSSTSSSDASSTLTSSAASTSAVSILSSQPASMDSGSSDTAGNTGNPLLVGEHDSSSNHSASADSKKAAMIGAPVAVGLVLMLAAALFFFRWKRRKDHDSDAIAPQGSTHWLDDDQHSFNSAGVPYKNPVRYYGHNNKPRKGMHVGLTDPTDDPFAPQPLSSPPLVNPFILPEEHQDIMQQTSDAPVVQLQRSSTGYSVHPNVPLDHVINFDAPQDNSALAAAPPTLQRQSSHDVRLAAATNAAFSSSSSSRLAEPAAAASLHRASAASSNYEPTLPDTPRLSHSLSPDLQHTSLAPEDHHNGIYAALTRDSVYSSDVHQAL